MLTYALSAAGASDQEFMLSIYEKYERLMFHTAGRLCQKRDLTEEAVQESLLRLIPKIPLLRTLEEAALVSYINVTIRNTAYLILRRQSRETALPLEEEAADEEESDPAEILQSRVTEEEERKALWGVWPKLSETDRFLLESRYVTQNSTEEIAQVLACSPGTVRMKLTRARRRAQKLMKAWEGGDCDGVS